ncbi:MAG: DUF3244 domain-containing protein [Bacteroidales bacterium]|nr:DUF3244 domain-containing protein [Bacteroidales bacterium]
MAKKFKTVLMLMLFVSSAAMGFAHGAEGTKQDEHDIIIILKTSHCGVEKGESIHATLNGHSLVVSFSENLGQVVVEVETISGGNVQGLSMLTPNGMQFYIPFEGDYIITFTLPNGDEYYGEFTVTD